MLLLPEKEIAILLNGNAKRVTRKVKEAFEKLLPAEDIFYSTNLRDSRIIAKTVVERRYRTILTGGGDGTFSTFLSHISNVMEETGVYDYKPRFGVLKLGTGNALAKTFGASDLTEENLPQKLYYAVNGASIKELRLLKVEGKQTPFAGLGLDAMILNDYNTVKELMKGTIFQSTSKGLLGYWIGLLTMGIPRYLLDKVPEAVIINEGNEAWQIDGEGKRIGPVIKKGDILFKGPIRMASAAKVPFYGFEFKLFPFAMVRDDKFHLRIQNASAFEILGFLPSAWKGYYTSGNVYDFLAENVSIYLSRPAPFQIGGDGEGWRSFVRFSLSEKPIFMIDFKPNVH